MIAREPLTPPGCDMTGMEFMPLKVSKLFGSDFWLMASKLEKLAAITLWAKSWHQVPAGSIPADDRILASMSEMGEDWAKVSGMALHGWVECADGRLYHPRVCEIALVAYIERLGHRLNSGAGNSQRWVSKGYSFDPWPLVDRIMEANSLLLALNPDSEKVLKINTDRLPSRGAPTPSDPPAIPSPSPIDPKVREGKVSKGKVSKGKVSKDVGGEPPTTPSADAPTGEGATGESGEKAADGPEAGQATTPKDAPKKAAGGAMDGLELPDWMPLEDWGNFVEMRRKMGKSIPFTLAAAKGNVRELGKLRDQGQDPAAVLQQSVNLGYRGVFALNGQFPPRVAVRESRYAAAGRAIFGPGGNTGSGVIDV